jgi:hypothetical protein
VVVETQNNKTGTKAGKALPIRIDEVYTLVEFQQRTGLGRSGLRSARKRGLPVRKCGRNKYVSGKDWACFLQAELNAGRPEDCTTSKTIH